MRSRLRASAGNLRTIPKSRVSGVQFMQVQNVQALGGALCSKHCVLQTETVRAPQKGSTWPFAYSVCSVRERTIQVLESSQG